MKTNTHTSSATYGRPRTLLGVLIILFIIFLIATFYSAVQFYRGDREHNAHAHTILTQFSEALDTWLQEECLRATNMLMDSGIARALTITTRKGAPILPSCKIPVTQLITTRYLQLIENYYDETKWDKIPLESFPDDIARYIIPDATLAAQAQKDRLAMIHASWLAAAHAQHAHNTNRAYALYAYMQDAFPTETDAYGFPIRCAAALEQFTLSPYKQNAFEYAKWLADVRERDLRGLSNVTAATHALVRRIEKMGANPENIRRTQATLASFLPCTGIFVYAESDINGIPVTGQFWLEPNRTPHWIRRAWIPSIHESVSNSFVSIIVRHPSEPATIGEYASTNIYGTTLALVPFDLARWSAQYRWRMGGQTAVFAVITFILLWLALRLLKLIRAEHTLQRNQLNFVAAVSHELRTPITAVRALAETLNRGILRTEEERETYAQRIISESDRLTQLVNNILDIARAPHRSRNIRMTSVPLAPVLTSAVNAAHITADAKGIKLTLNIHATPKITAAKDILERIFYNLLDNAIKYSHKGSDVTVSLTIDEHEAHVAVSDKGIGIMQEDIPHIFDRFFRAGDELTREYPGTGLGLAIVKECADLLNARIDVTSEYGKGSVFTVHFQRCKLKENKGDN